jgi:glycosyltransferase involved in cell wall biosynthesis
MATVVLDVRIVAGSGGGPDKTILNSPRYLEPLGYRMLCAYLHTAGAPGFDHIRRRAADLGAPLLTLPDRGPCDLSVLPRLLKICRRERVSIWHGHEYKSNLLGLLLRPFWPMHLVTTAHGRVEHSPRLSLYYAVDRWCLPRYDRVICVSEDLYRESLDNGVREDRCFLIENGIDLGQYSRRTDRNEAKRRLGIPAGRLVIGGVGRLSPEKSFDGLIDAVDRLLTSGYDIELLIAGEGRESDRLRSLIARLGRGDRIRLLGYQADTIALYEALDVFALSSLREGLPNVVLEAMAMEVPVVATRVAGIPRLIENDVNGLLVEAGSVSEMAEALAKLLGNSALRRRLSFAGRATIERDHSFEVRIQKIRDIYDRLLCSNHKSQNRHQPAQMS